MLVVIELEEEVALDPLTSLAMTSLPTHARAITSCPYVVRTFTVGPITLGCARLKVSVSNYKAIDNITVGPITRHGITRHGCPATTRNGVVWILASEPPPVCSNLLAMKVRRAPTDVDGCAKPSRIDVQI